jgi:hypothetical protein
MAWPSQPGNRLEKASEPAYAKRREGEKGGQPVKKPKAGAARRAAKRKKRAGRCDPPLRIEIDPEYVIAAWLATKPKSERRGLLARYASLDGILEAIRQDTAAHEAMLELLARDPAPGFLPA